MTKRLMMNLALGLAAALMILSAGAGRADDASDKPTTQVHAEYLMTLYAPLDPPQGIDDSLLIFNVSAGGWVAGPKIKGRVISPVADWLRIMPSGVLRLDVRLTVLTDDKQLIYVTYNGVIQHSKDSADRLNKGETMKADSFYFMTAPTFETKSEKYAWLNGTQAVGKMVGVKTGDGSFVKYEIFAVK